MTETLSPSGTLPCFARRAVPFLAAVLAGVILIPTLVPTLATVAFDFDPRQAPANAAATGGLTPGGLSVWALTLAVVAAMGWVVALAAGAAPRKGLTALALVGAGFMASHLFDSVEDGFHQSAWIAAVTASVAWVHLAVFPDARRWAAAVLLGVAPFWLLDALHQVFVQHPLDIAWFAQHRDELLAGQGIAEGSIAAELYERRLSFNDAIGPVGFSNVFASLAGGVGVLGVMGLVSAFATWRLEGLRKGPWAWATLAVMGGAGAAGLGVVALTHSKGGALAVLATLAVGGVAVFLKRCLPRLCSVWNPALGPLAVAAILGVVVVRLTWGPPALPADGFVPGRPVVGERSLLFRGHYMVAATRIAADHPLQGSGVRGFADAYPRVKPPLNPESVTSAHGVLVDQIAMLGLGGWALGGLLLGLLALGAVPLRSTNAEAKPHANTASQARMEPHAEAAPSASTNWRPGLLAGFVLFGVGLWLIQPQLTPDLAMLWLAAMAGFAGVVVVVGMARDGLGVSPWTWRHGWWMAAVFVAIHGQIEMSFFQPASTAVMWMVLAVAAGANGTLARKPQRWRSFASGGVLMVFSVLLLGAHANNAIEHDAALTHAATALRHGDHNTAIAQLAVAEDAAGLDRLALGWRWRLMAWEPLPTAASIQKVLGEVEAFPGLHLHLEPSGWHERYRARLYEAAANLPNAEPQAASQAFMAWRKTASLQPHHIPAALAHADAAARASVDPTKVQTLYTHVLKLRTQHYLDAADPLNAKDLARVQAGAHAQ